MPLGFPAGLTPNCKVLPLPWTHLVVGGHCSQEVHIVGGVEGHQVRLAGGAGAQDLQGEGHEEGLRACRWGGRALAHGTTTGIAPALVSHLLHGVHRHQRDVLPYTLPASVCPLPPAA